MLGAGDGYLDLFSKLLNTAKGLIEEKCPPAMADRCVGMACAWRRAGSTLPTVYLVREDIYCVQNRRNLFPIERNLSIHESDQAHHAYRTPRIFGCFPFLMS